MIIPMKVATMIEAGQLQTYFEANYGDVTNLLVRDCDIPSGLRVWDREDLSQLSDWLNSIMVDGEGTHRNMCYNVNEAAQVVGVGPHTIQAWLSKEKDPLPHIRTDRRRVIPHFMLMAWLREECLRTISR